MICSTDARDSRHAPVVYPRGDPYEKVLTGMTRDGTFFVQDGKIQYGVRNFRFTQT